MQKWFKLSSILLLIGVCIGESQILTDDRRIEWTPGAPMDFPDDRPVVNVLDHGAVGDGTTDNCDAFMAAIRSFPSRGGTLLIPEGDYLLNGSLNFDKGVVLSGEGSERTRLLFDLGGASKNCIDFLIYQRGEWVDVIDGFYKGSDLITVENSDRFRPGDFVEIQQENDPAVMYTQDTWDQSWAQNAVGQILTVTDIFGDKLKLDKGLYLNYSQDLNPVIRTQGFVTFGGVEKLYIKRLDAGDGHTIALKNTAYCRIREVESDHTYRTHISLTSSYRCTIRNNYLHHSHDYGDGGHGYGVDCINHSTDNLIENNIFHHLRHSMMVHVGASGNVFSYNYSLENYTEDNWTPCDVSLHGHYANHNLFESNIVQEVDVSDYWGPIGPGNTFLRNKVESKGIDVLDFSHGQNFIGNELGTGSNRLNIHVEVKNTLVHGHVERGEVIWDAEIPTHDIPVSYYLTQKPDFLQDRSWPLFGPDVETEIGLPALERFQAGRPITRISTKRIPQGTAKAEANLQLTVFPNPFNSNTAIRYYLPVSTRIFIAVYDISGKRVAVLWDNMQTSGVHDLIWSSIADAASVPSGIYLVRIEAGYLAVTRKILLLK